MTNTVNHEYRKDIDGLRAIAVGLVVIFHAFPKLLPGGFIGVDIFFVISGFLITNIILKNLKIKKFSFTEFYSRRVCRIFPSLILAFLFSLALGWHTLFPDEYALLGKHIFSSGFFYQNFNLLDEVGYFDKSSENKPFLHLWSLGIEEQFYLFWPFFLWVGYKLKSQLIYVIALFGFGSFALNLIYTNANQTIAFYSSVTRFWELLIGAFLAWYCLNKKSELRANNLSIAGAFLIVLGVFFITPGSSFPGWRALLPTIGAMLLIAAGSRGVINRTLLSNNILVWIGLISYPLYIWHWVLLSFLNILESGAVDTKTKILALLVSFGLAFITYFFVERFFRSNRFTKLKALTLILLMLVICFVSYNIFKRDGLSFRETSIQNINEFYVNNTNDKSFQLLEGFTCSKPEQHCKIIPSSSRKIFLWGDSHAQMLASGIKMVLPKDSDLMMVAMPGCRPYVVKDYEAQNECEVSNHFALNQIRISPPDIVLLAQRDSWDPQVVDSLHKNLISTGVKKILYLGKTPEWTAELPKIVYRKKWHSIPRYTWANLNLEALELDSLAKNQFEETPQKQFLDLIGFLCNDDGCLVYTGDNVSTGITFSDDNHLSKSGAEYVSKGLIAKYLK